MKTQDISHRSRKPPAGLDPIDKAARPHAMTAPLAGRKHRKGNRYRHHCVASRWILLMTGMSVCYTILAAVGSPVRLSSFLLSMLPRLVSPERKVPRVVRLSNNDNDSDHRIFLKKFNPKEKIANSVRYIKRPMANSDDLLRLKDSDEFEHGMADRFETSKCKAQYDWQKTSFVNCNTVHEVDMVKPISLDMKIGEARHVGNGFWRDVWSIPEEITNQYRVLKTIRLEHEMTPRNFERHRRDAMAMERLSSSPLVVDIYAFCGNSGVFEFADGGDLSDTLWPKQQAKRVTNSLSKKKKLRIATQITSALAAVHNFDREGRASVAHADISLNQFIKINGRFKLNDFNRARFLRWNLKHDRMCTFHVGNNPGKNRSPEEYRYEGQTEKIDVYSLGNLLYSLLQDEMPFHGIDDDETQELVKKGERPSVYADLWNSTDPVDQVLKQTMVMCHEEEQDKRASAREVEALLKDALRMVDPQWKVTDPI
jgi:hypothetical protein